ncbi:hypothetical protein LZ554_008488 [Drepanopeziza brunnea f. sp. 'monogermtubi']|nr:hypothetical protein LZ554_008488 [Drepanopeziza brunnea f. sp. 'monogermtubi']
MAWASLYPLSPKAELQKLFVGKNLKDVDGPAAVLDLGKLKNNCNRMLEAVETLGFGWRAHVKTHKTTELTRLQVGEGTSPVNIIVSTLAEAENIVPLLLEYKSAGRGVDLLYSFPITPAAVERLSRISKTLGPKGLSLMVDHPDQLPSVSALHKLSGYAPLVFLKIDMGGKRAGVPPQTAACSILISSLLQLEKRGTLGILGLYSHAGQSYSSSTRVDALDFLRQEFEALLVTAIELRNLSPTHHPILSVGATPTTTSIRNLLIDNADTPPAESVAIATLRATIDLIRTNGCSIEIHAGVYPTLDIQQLATHALPTTGPHAMLTWDDMALSILAEIASLYPTRGPNNSPEALVGSGVLALGREPCKAYPGWGILSNWNRPGARPPSSGPETHVGWQVGRLSQEHGVLVWGSGKGLEGSEGEVPDEEKLSVGQKVRIWPNHACIAGAGFGWYLVVDGGDEVVDVWPRWRGW